MTVRLFWIAPTASVALLWEGSVVELVERNVFSEEKVEELQQLEPWEKAQVGEWHLVQRVGE